MKKIILLIAITNLIVGCSTVASFRFTSDLIGFNENSNNGVIMGSITFIDESAKYNFYFPGIYSFEKNKSSEFEISPSGYGKNLHTGELQNGKTYLFAITKKPGKYKLNNIRFSKNSIGMTITKSLYNFSIPIDVEKGKIKYIGEITIDDNPENTKIVKLKDEFERDLNAIKKKKLRSEIDWDSTVKSNFEFIKQ